MNLKLLNPFSRMTFILALFSLITVKIPMPISDSNQLPVQVTELILPFVFLFFCYLFINKSYKPHKIIKYIIFLVIIFLVYYTSISVYRYIYGLEVKQSLLAIRTTLPPLLLLLLIDSKIIKIKDMLFDLVLINLLINIIQITHVELLRLSPFMGNIMVYLSVILMLIPLNFYILFKKDIFANSKYIELLSLFNILIAITFPALSGSRIAFALSVGIFIICLIVYSQLNKKIFIQCVLTFLIGLIVLSTLWYTNLNGISFGLYRLFPMDVKQITTSKELESSDELISHYQAINETVEVMKQETIASNNIRSYLWEKSYESLTENPFIGNGVMYFKFPNNFNINQQAAHNFLLEYANAYGIIGLLIFLSFIFIPLICLVVLNKKNLNKDMIVLKVNLLMTVGILFAISFFQPTMLIFTTVLFFWLVISYYYGCITQFDK